MRTEFGAFFAQAMGGDKQPYEYQQRLAAEQVATKALAVPTGCGKTAAAVLAWLWRRECDPANTPRRLVFVLPMRVLVEQTHDRVSLWLSNLGLESEVSVHKLLGGDIDDEWQAHPEKPAILIGTLDLIVSRALNRGYASSPFRWPMAFAALNNDCLWVCDEIQLMGNALATTSQLESFRKSMGTLGPAFTWWMSATLDPAWLNTVDYSESVSVESLTQSDRNELLSVRYAAPKFIEGPLPEVPLEKLVLTRHRAASVTLVVLNTVKRAQDAIKALQKALRTNANPPELILGHSLFRESERSTFRDRIMAQVPEAGRVIVATQVIEAGVDLSARLLITELCPWASLVQRLGRCNREGEYGAPGEAGAIVLEPKDANPYDDEQLETSRMQIQLLQGDASLARLETLGPPPQPGQPSFVLRRRDLLDLFDTSADLSGALVDVSRFVRDEKDTDVQVFWRESAGTDLADAFPARQELCRVPIYLFRDFLKRRKASPQRWDDLQAAWIPARPDEIVPGAIYRLPCSLGGYSTELGWDGDTPKTPEVAAARPASEGTGSDRLSFGQSSWLSLRQHSQDVLHHASRLADDLGLPEALTKALTEAAIWHDRGKAHEVFQRAIASDAPAEGELWAKRPGRGKPYERESFRHELASALAFLQAGGGSLPAYLILAHHGRLRGSIRSLPGEAQENGVRIARGVAQGDQLPSADLGSITAPAVSLDLSLMELGATPGWVHRVHSLLAELGPFRLAGLELLLRAADWRASAAAEALCQN